MVKTLKAIKGKAYKKIFAKKIKKILKFATIILDKPILLCYNAIVD